MMLEAEKIMTLTVQCAPCYEVKENLEGYLRVIPIVGGTFDGKLKGKIISGGADWNTEKKDGVSHVVAKYMIQTEDGCYISVENVGVIHWEDDAVIKTVPRFSTSMDSKYKWLNYGVYVGGLKVLADNQVEITVYALK